VKDKRLPDTTFNWPGVGGQLREKVAGEAGRELAGPPGVTNERGADHGRKPAPIPDPRGVLSMFQL
jgi:hypothetical protein